VLEEYYTVPRYAMYTVCNRYWIGRRTVIFSSTITASARRLLRLRRALGPGITLLSNVIVSNTRFFRIIQLMNYAAARAVCMPGI
jgi:hypothetical protein